MAVVYVPLLHDAHAVAPVVDEYEPPVQLVHCVAPDRRACLPSGHKSHSTVPSVAEYDPAVQFVHAVALADSVKVPAAHESHCVAPDRLACVPRGTSRTALRRAGLRASPGCNPSTERILRTRVALRCAGLACVLAQGTIRALNGFIGGRVCSGVAGRACGGTRCRREVTGSAQLAPSRILTLREPSRRARIAPLRADGLLVRTGLTGCNAPARQKFETRALAAEEMILCGNGKHWFRAGDLDLAYGADTLLLTVQSKLKAAQRGRPKGELVHAKLRIFRIRPWIPKAVR
eukprot:6376745-Prymnesium_polylepis.3